MKYKVAHVTVSPKHEIVIPREIRRRLGLRPRQRVTLIELGGMILAVPDQQLRKFRGILKGMPRGGVREKMRPR